MMGSLHVTMDWDAAEQKSGETTTDDEMLGEATDYYSWLYRIKKAGASLDFFTYLLSERQVPKAQARAIERNITHGEVIKSIRKSAKGKAPGTDGLPSEFYQTFETLIAADLLEVFNEIWDTGELPKSFEEGEIILLYKKGDPLDIRNYRPITLLNSDYKLFTKILATRLNNTLGAIVSKQQLGFVPGRVITEASHLVKLVQAAIDEDEGEGLLIALDWEKAFDSVSWEYIHSAVEALGYGTRMRKWIHTLYNHSQPPRRRIKANGQRGPYFNINSGVAQGCPASPAIFILVAEALTRAAMRDESIKGVEVRTKQGEVVKIKISQFADDTLFLLRSYASLRGMWTLIECFQSAHRGLLKQSN